MTDQRVGEVLRPEDGHPWAIMRQIDGMWTVIEYGMWENPETPLLTHTEIGDRLVVGERAFEHVGYEDQPLGSLMPKIAKFEPIDGDA